MNKLQTAVMTGLLGGALLGFERPASAQIVIGSWENLTLPPPPDPDPLPPFYHRPIGATGIDGTYDFENRSVYVNDTYGATNGSKSLKVQINPSDTGNRFSFNLLMALQEVGAVGNFLASGQFAIDVSWKNSDWNNGGAGNGFAGINQGVVNAAGSGVGFLDVGRATTDSFRDAMFPNDTFHGFWDKSFGDVTTTLTWDLTALVDGNAANNEVSAVQAAVGGAYLNIVLSTVYDSAFDPSTAAFYFDNARLLPRVVSSEWTGLAPDPDGDGGNGNAAANLWHASQNWTLGVPGAADSAATFGTNGGLLTGPQSVLTNQNTPIGAITFNNPAGYTIGGTGSIALDVSIGSASISVVAGSHTIQVPVTAADDVTFTSAAGSGVALTGEFTAAGRSITKTGAGSVQFQNVRSAALNVTGGLVKIAPKSTANHPDGTSVVNVLSIADGASLDLTNNSAVIDYTGDVGTRITDTRQNLASGKLASSSADTNHRLGYGDNALLGQSSFAGQTVDSSSILIKFTYAGDVNLDGQVDVTDLGTLATNWQTANVWTGGDFTYDGFVDVGDLGALATNWQAGVGNPLGPGSLEAALASLGLGAASVPEPGACVFIGVTAATLMARRRARNGTNR